MGTFYGLPNSSDPCLMFSWCVKPNYFIDVIDIHRMYGMCWSADMEEKEKFSCSLDHSLWSTGSLQMNGNIFESTWTWSRKLMFNIFLAFCAYFVDDPLQKQSKIVNNLWQGWCFHRKLFLLCSITALLKLKFSVHKVIMICIL